MGGVIHLERHTFEDKERINFGEQLVFCAAVYPLVNSSSPLLSHIVSLIKKDNPKPHPISPFSSKHTVSG